LEIALGSFRAPTGVPECLRAERAAVWGRLLKAVGAHSEKFFAALQAQCAPIEGEQRP